MRKTNKDKLDFGVAFLAIAVVLTALIALMQTHEEANTRENYDGLAESSIAIMHENLNSITISTNILKALVVSHDGDTSFFESEAPEIYKQAVDSTGVELRNLALAPNGVVTNVYPIDNNEQLLGFNFFDESKPGNAAAIEARDTGNTIMTNPFTLTQGGKAISTRQPVSLGGDGTTQWGLVTATMNFDDVISILHLESLDNAGANYSLWYEGEDGEKVEIASSSTPPENPETKRLSTMGINWTLDVSPKNGWINWGVVAAEEALALVFSALIAMLALEHRRTMRANETLRRLANLDGLTSCYSRHYVNTILVNQATGNWNDPHSKYSLVIVDIDRFKSINDTYGHDVGDTAIVTIANILMNNCRPEDGDCVIRHGGDEFVIVFNDVTLTRFEKKLDTIANQVRNARIEGHPDLRLTVSLGAEYYSDPETSRYYDMLNRADKKLYEAKEGGRDLIVL